jgi:hypothetical protein
MKKLWHLILIYFWPPAFLRVCVKHRGYETEEEINNVKEQESKRIKNIRKAQFTSFALVIIVSLSGFALASYINIYYPLQLFTIRVFRLISIIIIAWAVFSKLSKEIESIGGKSLPEQINNFSFRLFYVLGVFLAITSIFLEVSNVNA